MFYGVPPERQEKFNQAVRDILETYPQNIFAADNLISINRNLSYLQDQKFVESFKSETENQQDTSLYWRLHVLAWAAVHGTHFEGDFVEIGVDRGFSSAVICKYLDFEKLDKTFYLYDTFSGPPERFFTEQQRREKAIYYRSNQAEENYARVRNRFAKYPNVEIIRGIIPDTFSVQLPLSVAFLHIDLGSAEAEVQALAHLFDRLSPGAVLVLQNYGHSFCRQVMEAHNEFLHARNYRVLELPTAQGIVFKR